MHFIPLKKEPSKYSKFSAFASSALFHLLFNPNSVSFVEGRRKNISCLKRRVSYATDLKLIHL